VGKNDSDSKWLYGGCLLLCLGIGMAFFVGEYVIPKAKERAVEALRSDKDVRGAAASAVQQLTTAGKDVREEYENYLATMRSVSVLAGDAAKVMSFEEFKRQWERQGEGRVERWIREADLAKVFSKVRDRRVFCVGVRPRVTLAWTNSGSTTAGRATGIPTSWPSTSTST